MQLQTISLGEHFVCLFQATEHSIIGHSSAAINLFPKTKILSVQNGIFLFCVKIIIIANIVKLALLSMPNVFYHITQFS